VSDAINYLVSIGKAGDEWTVKATAEGKAFESAGGAIAQLLAQGYVGGSTFADEPNAYWKIEE
jgi:hypothetical protein